MLPINIFKNKILKSNWPFFVGLILTLSLLWPLVAASFFNHHDDVQVIRLHQMDKCFKDFQIPCRWVPDLGGLYGYPIFNYYAPMPYYFGEVIYFLSNNLIFSVKIMFAVSFVGSFLFMYLLSSRFWGKLGGALSAIFYSFAPYHALDFYVRGAMGEMWALMFFPAILWSVVRLEDKTNVKNLIFFSIFLFFLITSHNLSTIIFSPIILVWIFVLYLKDKHKKFILFSLMGIILGVLLSAFYLFPMALEKNLVHVETTTYGYFSYTEHFKGLRKLILDRSWGWGGSVREVPGGEREGLSYQIGWIHLLALALSVISAKYLMNKNRWLSWVIISSITLVLISIFMIHPRSQFIWKIFDGTLRFIQFPWRFLMITIFFISFMSGSIFLRGIKREKLAWSILVILVVTANFFYFRPEKFLSATDKDLLSGENWERQIKRSIFDYLPKSAKEPPAELAKERYKILTGDSQIFDFEQGSNWLKFKTETNTHTIIRLSQYYFPGWKILIDGKETNVEYANNSLGLMTIILGRGNHLVEGRLYDTQIRTIGNITTLVFWVGLVFVLLLQFKKVHQWIEYYRRRIN